MFLSNKCLKFSIHNIPKKCIYCENPDNIKLDHHMYLLPGKLRKNN